jgi:VCBS repeat-containing protein
MFVASRVESGDEGQVVAGLLPQVFGYQVIGYIEKAVGCGTLSRASGVAVQVRVGDPVFQGDAIETAADGRIGIRFIDGTLLHLSGSTRAVLNEFVCDSAGISHSALFEVTTGTFAFIAGHVAKTGCFRVDTPIGTIRGRAHSGGIGMLSLVALTFAVMMEARAADPNVTFLDDGSITYKNLEHGSFELVTKEAVPRHILVEDPGATIVLRAQGSSISVNQVANTTTRMRELQDAQQDVLANLAKELGPTGSSTPPSLDTLPLQPINFIQTDSAPSEQESLPPIPSIVNAVFETIVASPREEQPPPPPPAPPTLTAVAGPTEIDTVAFDEFTATSGTFAASSSDSGATLTFGISEADLGNPVLGGATFDVSKAGSFGTLYLNSTTGAYTFIPDSGAINALTAPTTETFVITVSDGTLSASQTFTIAINGTNDAAIISGVATGSVIEPGDATSTATGILTATDVDNPPNTFMVVSSPSVSDAGYGTFTMTADGTWTYTLNDAHNAVQALNVGGTLTDTFTVITEDGTAHMVTISIAGTNDAAIISGATTGSVVESDDHRCGTPTVTGTLTATDVDNPPDSFTAVDSPTASDAGYGTFTMTADGTWTYTLNDADGAV